MAHNISKVIKIKDDINNSQLCIEIYDLNGKNILPPIKYDKNVQSVNNRGEELKHIVKSYENNKCQIVSWQDPWNEMLLVEY